MTDTLESKPFVGINTSHQIEMIIIRLQRLGHRAFSQKSGRLVGLGTVPIFEAEGDFTCPAVRLTQEAIRRYKIRVPEFVKPARCGIALGIQHYKSRNPDKALVRATEKRLLHLISDWTTWDFSELLPERFLESVH